MNRVLRTAALSGLALTVLTISACTITRKPDGTIEVRESTTPSQDGYYNQINIGGKCYLSNGTWCIPCGGGRAELCETVRRVLGETPWQPQNQLAFGGSNSMANSTNGGGEMEGPPPDPDTTEIDPSPTMLWSIGALSNGLNGVELAEALGLDQWQPNVPHATVFSVNALDSVAETIDFTYITAWGASMPAAGTYANGVVVEYFHFGGDLTDNQRDAVAVRIAGPWDAAFQAASSIGSGQGQITTEYGQFTISFGSGSGSVSWNGVVVWDQ